MECVCVCERENMIEWVGEFIFGLYLFPPAYFYFCVCVCMYVYSTELDTTQAAVEFSFTLADNQATTLTVSQSDLIHGAAILRNIW